MTLSSDARARVAASAQLARKAALKIEEQRAILSPRFPTKAEAAYRLRHARENFIARFFGVLLLVGGISVGFAPVEGLAAIVIGGAGFVGMCFYSALTDDHFRKTHL